jgi:hypothetical protein
MLTLESKFAEYMKLITAIEGVTKPCEDATKPQSELLAKNRDLTIGDVFSVYRDDPDFDEGWGVWCLKTMGKQLGSDIRLMIINKLKTPMTCLQLLTPEAGCDFFTEDEVALLKGKYTGKLPTAEKEILDGRVILTADRVR